MFIFKEGSRNAFNNDRNEGNFKENYKKIFNLKLPHMDTVKNVMRKLNEDELLKLKHSMIQTLLRKKTLHGLRYRDRWFLVAIDGTGIISSSKRHCDNCLTKKSKNGKVTYMHNVLEAKLVCKNGLSISIATEWIENPDGDYDKQDCEQKAFVRLAAKIKNMYPRLPICIVADGLYPNNTFFEICTNNQWQYIVTFQDGNLPSVWNYVNNEIENNNHHSKILKISDLNKETIKKIFWLDNIIYKDHLMHWISCTEEITNISSVKKVITKFVYLSSLPIHDNNAEGTVSAGRLRWKIENEGFNIQKNNGYNLQHRYSRNHWLAFKNYYQCLQIGHLINQLVQLSNEIRNLAKGKMTIVHLWKCLNGMLIFGTIDINEFEAYVNNRSKIRILVE